MEKEGLTVQKNCNPPFNNTYYSIAEGQPKRLAFFFTEIVLANINRGHLYENIICIASKLKDTLITFKYHFHNRLNPFFMKKYLLLLLLPAIIASSCTSSKKSSGSKSSSKTAASEATVANAPESEQDGSSFEKAIFIKETAETAGVHAEYAWLKEHYPGYKSLGQSLLYKGKKAYDKLSIQTADGGKKEVYFDISNFFGKY